MNSESQIYQNLMHNSSLYMALKTGVSLIDFSIWSIELIFHVISLKFLRLRQCTYYLVKNWLDRKWEACAEERGAHSSISEWKQISLLFEKLKQYDHYVKLNFLAYSAISEAFIMITYESHCTYCLGYICSSKKKNLCTTSYYSILLVTMFWYEFYIFSAYTHKLINTYSHNSTQGRWNPKQKRGKITFPKWKPCMGGVYILFWSYT